MKLRTWLENGPFSLSLSAGFFGFYSHCGFVKALFEKGFRPQKIMGASAGALTGSLLSAGFEPEQIEDIIVNFTKDDFWDLGLGLGLLEGKKFRSHLQKHLPEQFSDLKIPLAVSAFNLQKLKGFSFSEGELVPAVLASCCFPGLFHPVDIQGQKFVDGGVADWMGLKGAAVDERVLIHNLEPEGAGSTLMKLQIFKRLSSHRYVVQKQGLIPMGPNRMHLGREAVEKAYQLTRRELEK